MAAATTATKLLKMVAWKMGKSYMWIDRVRFGLKSLNVIDASNQWATYRRGVTHYICELHWSQL